MPFSNTTQVVTYAKPVIPAAVAAYVTTPGPTGPDVVQQLTLTLAALPITIGDTAPVAQCGSVKILTFPEGRLRVLDCTVANLLITTTSAIASTLNSGVTGQFGLGSVAASTVTLATTALTFAPGTGQTPTAWTSSTVINVPPAVMNSVLAATVNLDGTTTAIPVFLNLSVTTATDIDADATVAVSGTIIFTYAMVGDY
jgi:hypothetical protein